MVGGAEELLGVEGVDAGLAAGGLLDVVFAADVAGVAVGGKDVLDRHARRLLHDLLRGHARVDDDGRF